MLTNAVSSAVGRLYAGTATVEPRQQVQRIEAVARLAAAAANTSAERDQREHASQRAALTQGVRLVFESASGAADTSYAELGESEPNEIEASAAAAPKQPESAPNPHLEEAILRFIHAVFRNIADAEGGPSGVSPPASGGAITYGGSAEMGNNKVLHPAYSSSRDVLGRRIESLAQRLQAAGGESDRLADDGSSGDSTGAELAQSFTEVLRALGVKIGDFATENGQPLPPTRGDLVGLMHKLSHAMQGAPPVDEGLPTIGGLLHARA